MKAKLDLVLGNERSQKLHARGELSILFPEFNNDKLNLVMITDDFLTSTMNSKTITQSRRYTINIVNTFKFTLLQLMTITTF